jgi:hypothetical protein
MAFKKQKKISDGITTHSIYMISGKYKTNGINLKKQQFMNFLKYF